MIDSNVYSEVYEILSYMDKETVMKVPMGILENIKNRRNKDYISKIDPDNIFDPQNVDEKTLEILACIDVNFWMEESKKEELKKKYQNKIKLEELAKKQKYGNYDLFANNDVKLKDNIEEKNELVVKKKFSWFQKILNLFKK